MNHIYFIIPILLPILGGSLLPFLFKDSKKLMWIVELLVLCNTILVWMVILGRPKHSFTLFYLAGNLSVAFKLDGMGCVFAGLISLLWPLASLYGFGYMKNEKRIKKAAFFSFYTMTYGITIGIAFAGNLLTLYMFYELLTLVTVPLVMYYLNQKSIWAANKYLRYSIGGAAFAFIGLIFILNSGNTLDFILGGVLEDGKIIFKKDTMLLVYVLTCCGFGVKAAIFPFHSWLPTASVAPTPVTALLHAVAVVKAGAFAILRITYYTFGVDFLKGTWAQYVMLIMAIITILFGSSMAVKEVHLKRRLAYSTISNLSYIIFSIMIMTPLGMIGAMTHMIFHGLMKICSFFCIGSVMHQSGREYVNEIDGLAKKMPITFGCFTIAALALIGVPPLTGFTSKWNIAKAAVSSGNPLAYIGLGVLMVSSVLTAIYMFVIVVNSIFKKRMNEEEQNVKEPEWTMVVPLVLFAAAIIILGFFPNFILQVLEKIAVEG